MKIGILFQNHKNKEISWQKHTEIYSRTENRVNQIANILKKNGHTPVVYSSFNEFLKKITIDAIDLLLPCIECCFERNAPGFIPSILDMKHLRYVGNDAYTNIIVSDKYLFKCIANKLNIHTPSSILIEKNYNILNCLQKIKFPYVLKYRYGSMSYHTVKVFNFDDLKKQSDFMLGQNNGPILCEEYINGCEISVPVIGTAPNEQILSVIEYTDLENNPLDLYDFYWKGKNDKNIKLNIFKRNPSAIKEIIYSVHKLYNFLGYQDYARFDFRLDNDGHAYLLEGNPLPALSYESAFDPKSYGLDISFNEILMQIINFAAKRYNID